MMKVEIRAANDATIEGYVNAVGRDSRIMRRAGGGKFIEQIVPKTFERALGKAKNVEVRFNHSAALGSTKDGSLELHEDNIGLYARARITDSDVIEKAKKHELRGWSFGFVCSADRWEDAGGGIQRRFIEGMELREVSILDKTPAYIATSIEMRDEDSTYLESRLFDETLEVRDLSGNQPEPTVNFNVYEKEIDLLKIGGRKL